MFKLKFSEQLLSWVKVSLGQCRASEWLVALHGSLLVARTRWSVSWRARRVWCRRRSCCSRTRCTTERWRTSCWGSRASRTDAPTRSGAVSGDASTPTGSLERRRRWRFKVVFSNSYKFVFIDNLPIFHNFYWRM